MIFAKILQYDGTQRNTLRKDPSVMLGITNLGLSGCSPAGCFKAC